MMSWTDIANLIVNGLVEGLVVALPALSMTLVMGVNRFPNAATGDFLTLGAYVAVLFQMWMEWPLWQAAAVSMLVVALVSLGSYQLVFRQLVGRPMVSSMLAAIGLGFLLRSLISFFAGHEQRTFDVPLVRAWNVAGIRILPTDMVIAGIALVCLMVVFVLLYQTSFGRQLRAIADSTDLARASGIRAGRLMLALWLLVGGISALGGVLLGMKAVVMPEMGWDFLIPAFAAMVLGGIGSPLGAVLGALALCVAQELSVPWLGPSYKLVLSFTVLALVLLLRPRGILGRIQLVR